MLYLNSVQILGQRRELTTEELRKLIERVDREKQGKAQERLSGQNSNRPAQKLSQQRRHLNRIQSRWMRWNSRSTDLGRERSKAVSGNGDATRLLLPSHKPVWTISALLSEC